MYARLMGVIDDMASTFCGASRFAPSSLMFSASADYSGDNSLDKDFHFYKHGCFTFIHVHGSPKSKWSKKISEDLGMSGYERVLELEDEVGFKRWLTDHQSHMDELEFLKKFGINELKSKFKSRTVTSGPVGMREITNADWVNICNAVRSSGVPWNVCSVGYSREKKLGDLTLEVSCEVFDRLKMDRFVAVRVHVKNFDKGMQEELRQELVLMGYDIHIDGKEIWGIKPELDFSQLIYEADVVFNCIDDIVFL